MVADWPVNAPTATWGDKVIEPCRDDTRSPSLSL